MSTGVAGNLDAAFERATRECSTSPQIATISPSMRPLRRRMVKASSSAWVGCSPVPSPALITGQSMMSATSRGAPLVPWRITRQSGRIAFSVRAVSSSVSPFHANTGMPAFAIAAAASGPHMAYHNARAAALSTGPLSIAAPGGGAGGQDAAGQGRLGDGVGDGLFRGGDRTRHGGALHVGDKGLAVPVPALVGVMAGHHHRRPILSGHGHVATPRLDPFQQVAERGHAQMIRGDGVGGRRATRDPLVLRAINALIAAGLREVEPVIGDDPGPRRARAGHDRGVARAGLGRIVRLIAVAENGALLYDPRSDERVTLGPPPPRRSSRR